MKNLVYFLVMSLVLLITRVVHADDSANYYQYLYDQKVTVSQTMVEISFKWSRSGKKIFKAGDEFEIGVIVDPKIFARPPGGYDHKLDEGIKTNFPCGYRDVFNYDIPGDKEYLYETVFSECEKLGEMTENQKMWLRQIAGIYPEWEDPNGNFSALSLCPEKFKADTEYHFTYFLEKIPDAEKVDLGSSCANGKKNQPDWGFFWINAKVQPDTLWQPPQWYHLNPPKVFGQEINVPPQQNIVDCPYLIGLPADIFLGQWYGNKGTATTLFNRGCTPATNIPWGFSDPAKKDWRSVSGHVCRKCDDDDFYDSDFQYPMYGDKVGDCNDNCSVVSNKPNLSDPHASIAEDLYCSKQCNGQGCGAVGVNACFVPDWCQLSSGCHPGNAEETTCLVFGKKVRICLPDCTWTNWTACQFETACANCPEDLEMCTPGAQEAKICPDGVFLQKRKCDSVGQWSPWIGCSEEGTGGSAGQSGNAGAGGTSSGGAGQAGSPGGSSGTAGTGGQAGSNQAGTSGAGGNTGSAGTSSCECTSGVCCSGCVFYPASTQCGSTQTYRCEGTNPGDDAQVANVFQFCSGSSNLCNGAITQDAWQTYESCGSTELCLETGGLPYCSAPACSEVFKTTTVQDPCYTNPQNPNSPELCLEMNQISGSTWEYRVCKGNGSGFSNTIKHRLTDQNINHPKQWSWKTYSSGASCTSWVTVDMSYLTQNGTSQGAGLQAEVLSPSSCVDAVCTLRTGQIGVYKTCE